MCGLTASIYLQRNNTSPPSHVNNGNLPQTTNGHSLLKDKLQEGLEKSLEKIAHRGPDARGVWTSEDGTIGIGNARLSINDLTPSGNQPIHSDDGTVHCVVNGEIYGFDQLREQLAQENGYKFHSHSDSEVLVALYKVYGAPAFFEHLRGEFAFVLYDETANKVIAARDRFGVKPVFWTVVDDDNTSNEGKKLLIASEAKAFLPLGWNPEWDVAAVVDGGWFIDNRTPFKGVSRIAPGYWMEVLPSGEIKHHQYFDTEYKNKNEVETRSTEEMVEGIRERMTDAIRVRLRADVPIGIYLSGGIDSAFVAGIATKLVREEGVLMGTDDATKRIHCFTIQFPNDSGFDESDMAIRTADWLGVDITKKEMNENEIARYFEDAIYHNENGVYDVGLAGKFGLSEVAHNAGFKVVLSGEGSDEHFAGYPMFPLDMLAEADGARPDTKLAQSPELRQEVRAQFLAAHQRMIPHIAAFMHGGPEETPALRSMGNTATHRLMTVHHPYPNIYAPWVLEQLGSPDPRDTIARAHPEAVKEKMRAEWHPLHAGAYAFLKATLPNFTLSALGDRVEMAHGIEARPPFLDHRVTRYADGLPPSAKMAYTPDMVGRREESAQGHWWEKAGDTRNLCTEKWILRQAARPYVTDEMYERKKHIYSAPTRWPRDGPLHRLVRGLVTPDAVDAVGFLEYEAVRRTMDAAFGGDADLLAFRKLMFYASWVVLSKRFGIKKATPEDLKAR